MFLIDISVLRQNRVIFRILNINQFVPDGPFLYPLKTSKKRKCFRVVEKGCIGKEWVIKNVKYKKSFFRRCWLSY